MSTRTLCALLLVALSSATSGCGTSDEPVVGGSGGTGNATTAESGSGGSPASSSATAGGAGPGGAGGAATASATASSSSAGGSGGGTGGSGGAAIAWPATWSKRFVEPSINESGRCYGVAVDRSDAILITGQVSGAVDFGGGPLPPAVGADVFVARFDGAGDPLWSARYGADDGWTSRGLGIAAGASGNILVAGRFLGAVDFGGGTMTASGSAGTFVAELGSDGSHLWSKQFATNGGGVDEGVIQVATDDAGSALIAGCFAGSTTFGGPSLVSAGGVDVFVAKLDAAGAHVWSSAFGGPGLDCAIAVTSDGGGGVVVAGFFEGTLDVGNGPLTSAGDYDIFVARLDASGTALWSKAFGDANSQRGDGISVSVDAAGAVYLVASSSGALDFGGGPVGDATFIDDAYGSTLFAVKLDAAGNHAWSHAYPAAPVVYGWPPLTSGPYFRSTAALTPAGHLMAFGTLGGSIDFGGGVLGTTDGEPDLVVLELDGDGAHVRSQAFPDVDGPGGTEGRGVAADSAGNAIITGSVHLPVDFGNGVLAGPGSGDIFLAKMSP